MLQDYCGRAIHAIWKAILVYERYEAIKISPVCAAAQPIALYITQRVFHTSKNILYIQTFKRARTAVHATDSTYILDERAQCGDRLPHNGLHHKRVNGILTLCPAPHSREGHIE